MGSKLSTTSTCAFSLLDQTKEDIAHSIVEQLGSVYAPYSDRIIQHNISGAVLWSFRKELHDESNQNLIQYILNNDLGITNSIHQRVLYLEFLKLVKHEEECRLSEEVYDEIPKNISMQQSSVSVAIKRSSIANYGKKFDGEYTTDCSAAEMTIGTASNTVSSVSPLNFYSKIDVVNRSNGESQYVNKSVDDFSSSEKASLSDHDRNKIVLRGFGPVDDVTLLDVLQYEPSPTLVATCNEIGRGDSLSIPANCAAQQRTAMLPIFHNEFSANRMENTHFKEHLPDNYYTTADQMNVDHSPLHIHDADRVALLESLSLKSIMPSDPTGIALKHITDLAAQIFNCDYVEVTFLTHDKCYNIANHMSCTFDASQVINSIKIPIIFNEEGSDKLSSRPKEPWLCAMERGLAFCNYVAYTGRTFTLKDVYADASFSWAREAKACQFYSGSPIIVRGCHIASLCVYDFRQPHPEFSIAHQIQQEQLADMAADHIENWVLRIENKEIDRRRSVSSLNSSLGTSGFEDVFQETKSSAVPQKQQFPSLQSEMPLVCEPPEKFAAVVFTDVQGSTSLWEFNAAAMQEALNLHDQIIRQTIVNHHGYEIKTEGDSFQIVFHECRDAVLFALMTQEALHSAPWSREILSHPTAIEDTENGLRGLRVRMAIHYGPVSYHLNEVSCRRDYTGRTVNMAKSLESMAYGGQILITSDAWNRTCHLSTTALRSPQVLDLGVHILLTGSKKNEGIIEKCVLQLVPRTLAFDYTCQGSYYKKNDDSLTDFSVDSPKGRQFPKLPCTRRLSASFQDAPFEGNLVTILFLAAKSVEELYDDSALILSALAKHVSFILRQFPTAYQCKDLMIAFPCPSDAIRCGLSIQDYLRSNNTVAGVSLKNMIKIGLHHGPFTSMGPDLTTGRADYFGVVVNRAARIADAAQPGEVFMGVIASIDCEEPPPLENGLKATFAGRKALKGINEEMNLYNCFLDRGVMKRTSSIRSRRVLSL